MTNKKYMPKRPNGAWSGTHQADWRRNYKMLEHHNLTHFLASWNRAGVNGYKPRHNWVNPLSTRPHQNVVWYNNSWLGFLNILIHCTKRKRKIFLQKMSPHLSQLNVAMAHRNYFRRNNLQILKLAKYTKIEYHYSRCKLATFYIGKDCQMFIFYCLPKTKFYWFVMRKKKKKSVANLMIQ